MKQDSTATGNSQSILFLLICLMMFLSNALAQSPVRVWSKTLTDPGELPVNIAIDDVGNIYAANFQYLPDRGTYEWLTSKYSPAGLPLWTNHFAEDTGITFQPFVLALDNTNKVVVAGQHAMVAYSLAGVPLWTNRFGTATLVPGNGYLFVWGAYPRPGRTAGYATFAYSPDGVPIWTNYFGPAGYDSYPGALIVNKDGFPIVSGTSRLVTTSASNQIVTLAYSHEGLALWTNRYEKIASTLNLAGMAALSDGGVVLAINDSQGPFSLLKYSSLGAPAWTNLDLNSLSSSVQAITPSPNGCFYVAAAAGTNFLTKAYSTDGTPLWTNAYNLNGGPPGWQLAVDAIGNVLVSAGPYGSTLVAYQHDGVPLWTNSLDGMPSALVTGTAGTFTLVITNIVLEQFALNVPLTIQRTSAEAVLNWTNSAFGWTNLPIQLQSSSAAEGPFTNVPGAASPYPIDCSLNQAFFRLIPALQ